VPHTRIFFWRYLAWGAILVLALGPKVGLGVMVLAYWPVLRSAKRTARRINAEVDRKAAWNVSHWPPRTSQLSLAEWKDAMEQQQPVPPARTRADDV